MNSPKRFDVMVKHGQMKSENFEKSSRFYRTGTTVSKRRSQSQAPRKTASERSSSCQIVRGIVSERSPQCRVNRTTRKFVSYSGLSVNELITPTLSVKAAVKQKDTAYIWMWSCVLYWIYKRTQSSHIIFLCYFQ